LIEKQKQEIYKNANSICMPLLTSRRQEDPLDLPKVKMVQGPSAAPLRSRFRLAPPNQHKEKGNGIPQESES
jgi:hypothetical protein